MKKKHDLAFVLPAILVVAIMTQVPFVLTLIYSTLGWNLARPDLPVKFVGFDNYLFFLRIPHFPAIPCESPFQVRKRSLRSLPLVKTLRPLCHTLLQVIRIF